MQCNFKSKEIDRSPEGNLTKIQKNVQEESQNNINGDSHEELIYYFEPQLKLKATVEDTGLFEKTETEKQINAFKILCIACPSVGQAVYDDRFTYELHFKKCHKDQPLLFGCPACDYNAKKFILLRNHFKRHLVGRNTFHCNTLDCPQKSVTYSQKSDLNYHKETKHGLKVCQCNLEFENAESFIEHKNSCSKTTAAGSKTKPTIACEVCGKILQTAGGLFTHKKQHQEKPKFRCEVCQKEFFQKVNLLNHEKTHNVQNRNFSCSQCDKSFFERSHLLRHQNFHSESRDFQCEQCLKFYKTERCLKVHKQVHSDPSNRPFKCSVCQKGFLSSSKLRQHENIHSNSRPFLCKHCTRTFTNYPNLLKHTIRRHKVDHRTGKPLSKIPDYVTNKKKKKTTTSDERTAEGSRTETTTARSTLSDEINVMKTLDNDLELPSTSGLIKGFQFGDDANYDMSIMLDIDEFSDFQLLSPNKEDFDAQDDVNDAEQFSIIDATDLQFFSENTLNPNIIHLVSSGQ